MCALFHYKAWLNTRASQEADHLLNFFNKIYDDVHSFVQIRLKAKMFIREALYIRQCIDVLQGILEIEEDQSKTLLISIFLQYKFSLFSQKHGLRSNWNAYFCFQSCGR